MKLFREVRDLLQILCYYTLPTRSSSVPREAAARGRAVTPLRAEPSQQRSKENKHPLLTPGSSRLQGFHRHLKLFLYR